MAARWTKHHFCELLGRLGSHGNAVDLMNGIARLDNPMQSSRAALYHPPNYVATHQLVSFEGHSNAHQGRQAVPERICCFMARNKRVRIRE